MALAALIISLVAIVVACFNGVVMVMILKEL